MLNRAAERQEGGARPGGARYSLAEIQEIAAGAGIAASHVASVAAGLRESRERGAHRFLGAPWRFRFEETIDGEVADDVVGELIELASGRRRTGDRVWLLILWGCRGPHARRAPMHSSSEARLSRLADGASLTRAAAALFVAAQPHQDVRSSTASGTERQR
ncbi:MAG: hypothetical protein ACT4P7_16395 [Gemmatimonadaceae bacterium]